MPEPTGRLIPAIEPAEVFIAEVIHEEYHCRRPQRIEQALKTFFELLLDLIEDVPPLERVTSVAHRSLLLGQDRTDPAAGGGDSPRGA